MAITFETLPPEIRSLIYLHLFSDAKITISHTGIVHTIHYPYQITGISRHIRHETYPLLRTPGRQHRIRLECEGGRFPDAVRRRIPSYILRNIAIISLFTTKQCPNLLYDEVKPTRHAFPNLETLEFNLYRVRVCMVRMMTRHARRQKRPLGLGYEMILGTGSGYTDDDGHERSSKDGKCEDDDPTGQQGWCAEVRRVIEDLSYDLKTEEERPREGLEQDYFAQDSLFEFLMYPTKREVSVRVSANELVFTNDLGGLPGVKFNWDDIESD